MTACDGKEAAKIFEKSSGLYGNQIFVLRFQYVILLVNLLKKIETCFRPPIPYGLLRRGEEVLVDLIGWDRWGWTKMRDWTDISVIADVSMRCVVRQTRAPLKKNSRL